MKQETQGKTEKDIINQDRKQTQSIELVSPKAGTATATNVKEATQLIENGFKYVQEMDGIRLYRKRK